ncbi:MAG: D-2-hydroxyacid dehydrogenase, partial [Clostridiaceae bacterium]|nr:D-2-hydroxyacid dehydrogenase [Clostridiaceae bacterium]
MRKIVITEQLKPGQLLQIEELLPQWEVICCENECADIDLLRSAEIITGFVGGEQTNSVLAGTNKLRWLHVWSAGVDSLPLGKLAEQDVILTNSSGVHTYSITEVIFMFLLGLSRNMQYSLRSQIRQE